MLFFVFVRNKKRYAGLMWTNEDKYDYMDTKGLETVRRDNCGLVREVIQTVPVTIGPGSQEIVPIDVWVPGDRPWWSVMVIQSGSRTFHVQNIKQHTL